MIGKKTWVIAEGYIPKEDGSGSKDRTHVSHETACILNPNKEDAHLEITLYFKDRAPVGPYKVHVGSERTYHMRFDDLSSPAPVPKDTDFSSIIRSNVPVVIQHTRLDSRNFEKSLLSTTAYSED